MATRSRIFARDGFACVLCATSGKAVAATICDHVVPLALGGGGDDANLRSLCADCSDRVTREALGWQANRMQPKTTIGRDGFPLAVGRGR